MTTKPKEAPESPQRPPVAFSKAQMLASKMFQGSQKDVLAVVLDASRKYTIPEAEALIRGTLERKVQ